MLGQTQVTGTPTLVFGEEQEPHARGLKAQAQCDTVTGTARLRIPEHLARGPARHGPARRKGGSRQPGPVPGKTQKTDFTGLLAVPTAQLATRYPCDPSSHNRTHSRPLQGRGPQIPSGYASRSKCRIHGGKEILS